MSMMDHYRLNVAQQCGHTFDGKPRFVHLFATEAGSARDRDQADILLALFRVKFPAEQGFQVSMTHWQCRGTKVSE